VPDGFDVGLQAALLGGQVGHRGLCLDQLQAHLVGPQVAVGNGRQLCL